MDRRYQVFVSSTYTDLEKERSEAIQALLELDCMPAGMELFPAASETQWKWIQQIIDESDYYIVILAGRYGTVHPDKNISYTEMEYRYALSIGKPVLAFLHENIADLPNSKHEKKATNQKKLAEFRELCEKQLCKYWDSPQDLAAKVSRSLTQLIKREPAVGWIRADQVNNQHREELVELKQENLELREKIGNATTNSITASELASGDDIIQLDFHIETKEAKLNKAGRKYKVNGRGIWFKLEMTWNQILFCIGPALSSSTELSDIYDSLNSNAKREANKGLIKLEENEEMVRVKIGSSSGAQIKMQLEGLGLIRYDNTKRFRNWTPTDLGYEKIIELTTLKKGQNKILSMNDIVPKEDKK